MLHEKWCGKVGRRITFPSNLTQHFEELKLSRTARYQRRRYMVILPRRVLQTNTKGFQSLSCMNWLGKQNPKYYVHNESKYKKHLI